MARYTGADCKLCRREKMKLFLKGAKCDSPKCPIEIRPYPPGEHGRNRPEGERVPAPDPGEAEGHAGSTGSWSGSSTTTTRRPPASAARPARTCSRSWRAAWTTWSTGPASPRAGTWPASWSRHGHFLVNGKKVDIPSYRVTESDIVEVAAKSVEMTPFVVARAEAGERHGARVARGDPGQDAGPGAHAPGPGPDRHPGSGAAHRRAVLEVRPAGPPLGVAMAGAANCRQQGSRQSNSGRRGKG